MLYLKHNKKIERKSFLMKLTEYIPKYIIQPFKEYFHLKGKVGVKLVDELPYTFDLIVEEPTQIDLSVPSEKRMYKGQVIVNVKCNEIDKECYIYNLFENPQAILGRLITKETPVVNSVTEFEKKQGYYSQGNKSAYCHLCSVTAETIISRKDGREWRKINGVLQDTTGKVANFTHFNISENDFEKCKKLAQGDYVLVSGDWTYNDYSKSDEIDVNRITLLDSAKESLVKNDNSGKSGRYELNVTTQMSTMASLNEATHLVNQASLYGLNGLAITDDNSVQGVNDVLQASKGKKDLKTLLGSEINVLNDEEMKIFLGKEYHGSLLLLLRDNEFYVFDTETTGLSRIENRITQMSSVKMKHGQEVDTFDSYANPEQSIPKFLQELTHLTDVDLTQYPTSDEVVLKWLNDFVGVAHPEHKILVAHNAQFDLSMIDTVLLKHGLPKLEDNFTIIDTLTLARFLLRNFRQHKLGYLADSFSLDLDAHNAFNDTRATSIVLYYLLLLCVGDTNADTLAQFEFSKDSYYFGDSDKLSIDLKNIKKKTSFKNSLSQTNLAFYKGKETFDYATDDVQNLVQILRNSFNIPNENGIANMPFGYGGSMSVIAKDLEGRKVLYKLLTKAHTVRFYRSPRIWLSDIKALSPESRSHILLGTGNDTSAVNDYMKRLGYKYTAQFIKEVGFDYIEVCPPSVYYFDANNDKDMVLAKQNLEQMQRMMSDFVKLEQTTGIPCVAVSESRYLIKTDSLAFHILKNQLQGASVKPLYLRKPTELYQEFTNYVDAETAHKWVYENTMKVGNLATPNLPLAPSKLNAPEMPNAKEELINLTHAGLKKYYGDNPPQEIVDRMNTELNLLIKNGYEVIYLLAHKIVKHANDSGYLVGSRGSVGSSLVALFCGITEINALPPHYRSQNGNYTEFVDPKKWVSGFDLPPKKNPVDGTDLIGDGHNIPFETFLGTDGTKIPDIDLNFEKQAQAEGHAYLRELFGKDHTIRVGTVESLSEKTPLAKIKAYESSHLVTFDKAQESYLAQELTGVKSTTGQHPAGILIIPKDKEIEDFTPQQFPANKTDSPWKTSHLPMTTLHDCLLKMDVLGQDSPLILRKLRDLTGVDPHSIKPNDPKVISLFTSAKELGLDENEMLRPTGALALPEFGTDFVLQMLVETQPSNFSDLVQISGLSHGTNVWIGNAQDLIKEGRAELSEVIASRDKLLTDLFSYGLSYEDANEIVYRVKKKKPLTEHLVSEMENHNLPEWYLESIKKIKYMFPKGHATSYVQDAVRTAFYKLYYPYEFYSVWLSTRSLGTLGTKPLTMPIADLKAEIQKRDEKAKKNFTFGHKPLEINKTRAMNIIYEARLRGIEFLAPNVNLSEVNEWKIIEDNGQKKIIAPLTFIKGVGEKNAIPIVETRKALLSGRFDNKAEFLAKFKSTAKKLDKEHCIDFE